MRRSTQWLLAVLFGFSTFCMLMTTPLWQLHEQVFWWSPCCRAFTLLVPPSVTSWLVVLIRGVIVIVLAVGIYLVIRRLWQSYHFLIRLNIASALANPFALPSHFTAFCSELGLIQRIVVLPTQVPLAFCFGLLSPRICISTGLLDMLTDRELKAVLLHEDYHQRHYDPLRTLVIDAVAALLFFLPIVAEWRDLFRTATELAADRYTINTMGRSPLAGALHKLLTHPLALHDSFFRSGINGLSATEARLSHLLDNTSMRWHFSPRRLFQSTIFLLLICIMVQVLSL